MVKKLSDIQHTINVVTQIQGLPLRPALVMMTHRPLAIQLPDKGGHVARNNRDGMLGLRHVALNVKDIQVSQQFYEQVFGMKVVWRPDAGSVYLSSGSDNLALHQIPDEQLSLFQNYEGQHLDHLGFLIDSPANVDVLFQKVRADDLSIVKPLKQHRDGSYSFYVSDPDGNVVQVLYEPTVSKLEA